MGTEKFDLKAVEFDGALDRPEPAEQATVPAVSGDPDPATVTDPDADADATTDADATNASASVSAATPQRGNEVMRGIVYGVGFGLLLWGVLAAAVVTLIVLLR